MYIPKHFQGHDVTKAVEFINTYNFGLVVAVESNRPIGTHLPFNVHYENDKLTLVSHLARANSMSDLLDSQEILCVFSEPHAYISPIHYEKKLSVPTWDYVAVHAYGRASVIEDPEKVVRVLRNTVELFDPSYLEEWLALPSEYITGMLRGLVAFEIHVQDLQFKEKLSQNRSNQERMNIAHAFEKSDDQNERIIGNMIKTYSNKTPE
ncbi:MAG: FMN-binding negative transcriptional regulator [Bacteroidia bacterium]|nr:FMN-binding negative transcriptional regulator [Bacteroidia bacterium]